MLSLATVLNTPLQDTNKATVYYVMLVPEMRQFANDVMSVQDVG